MGNKLEDLLKEINEHIASFETNSSKQLSGNKAAGTRARKATNKLTKLFKEFRKESVKY